VVGLSAGIELQNQMDAVEFSHSDRLYWELANARYVMQLLVEALHRIRCEPWYPGNNRQTPNNPLALAMIRFTTRELLLLTVMAALTVGWFLDHRALAPKADIFHLVETMTEEIENYKALIATFEKE